MKRSISKPVGEAADGHSEKERSRRRCMERTPINSYEAQHSPHYQRDGQPVAHRCRRGTARLHLLGQTWNLLSGLENVQHRPKYFWRAQASVRLWQPARNRSVILISLLLPAPRLESTPEAAHRPAVRRRHRCGTSFRRRGPRAPQVRHPAR